MPGLIRTATRARTPRAVAIRSMRASSPADSALIAPTPMRTASSSSAAVLPTPVKTISPGSTPARRATAISPPELASTALPADCSSRTMPSVEFAFNA